ncbi:MAG: LptA/OstA family protein [Myxococcota bacterium]
MREKPTREENPRRLSLCLRAAWFAAGCVLWVGGNLISAQSAAAALAPVRIAVAPFEYGSREAGVPVRAGNADLVESDRPSAEPDFAKLLAGRLALRDLERLIVPSEWVAEPLFEPHAEQVRRWAHGAAVEHVVLGRVVSEAAGRQVEIVIRSGHSGAELYRHQVMLSSQSEGGSRSGTGWAAALDPLAAAIMGDLGEDARVIEGVPGATAGPGETATTGSTGSGRTKGDDEDGFASKLDLGGFTSDAPIEINADEAEIQSRGSERRLIFQNNVRVKQANIRLRSDRLQADYRKGESEPRQLIARGHVKIDQGGRKASCDQAIYQREAQKLVCRGHAELIQGCDIVRGESIEFDLAGDEARVQGAASIVIRPESEGSTSSSACSAGKGLM